MNLINSKKRSTLNSITFEIILTLLFFLSLFPFISQAQVTQDFSVSSAVLECIDENLIDASAACTTIYEPVCGCNGVTYPNECVAQNYYGVSDWTDGPCNNCNLEVDITSFEYTCIGADVCVGVFSGQAPFTISVYNTNTGNTTASDDLEVCFSDLEPGNYEVVIVDASGCSAVLFFSVPVIDYNIEAEVIDVSCFGGQNGAINLWIPAGLPVWIEWTGPDGFVANTEDIDNLFAGLYTVQVSLIDGSCYASGTYEVGQADELSTEFIRTGSQCDGQVDGCLIIQGGTQPYHVWVFTCDNPVNGNLPEPDFDNAGNISIDGMEQTDVVNLDANGIYQNEICAQNIPAGTYYVLVADANWCWTFEVIEVGEEEGITAEFEITSDICNDQVDGCLFVNGGAAPYDVFVWQLPYTYPSNNDVNITPNGPTIDGVTPNSDVEFENDGTSNDFQRCAQNIPAGTHLVLVVDANHCYVLLTVEIPHVNPLTAEFFTTSQACDDQVDGCLLVMGGTQPYNINVFTCPDTLIGTNLPDPVIDANGNVSVAGMYPNTDLIDENSTILSGDEICVEDIPAGTYYVIIYDANGCWTYLVVEIPETNGLTLVGEMIDVSCFGGTDGAIELAVIGGVPPYTAYWTNEAGETGDDFHHLSAGTYEVFVYDANQCTATATFTIHQPTELKAEFEITSDNCADQVDGCLHVDGGTGPYHVFVWNLPQPYPSTNIVDVSTTIPTIDGVVPNAPIEFENDGTTGSYIRCANNIPAGAYLVLIVDANACYTILTVEIPEADPLSAEFIITSENCDAQVDGCLLIFGGTQPYNINVFTCPDPTVIVNVDPVFEADGTVSIDGMVASDDVDVQPTEPNGYYGNEICVEDIPAGIYYVIIDDANGCWTYIIVEIPETHGLIIEGETKNVSCHGGNDGAIDFQIVGGTPPYTAYWVNNAGETGDNFNHLSAGTYEVLVFDANQCFAVAVFTIYQPSQLKAEFQITSEACDAEIDACLYIHGGTPAYRLWVFTCPNPLPTLPEPDFSTDVPSIDGMVLNSDVNFPTVSVPGELICAENIPPATYYVLIADENNCWIVKTIEIEPAAGIGIEGEVMHVTCSGNDGAIDITVIGNQFPYFFEWSNGATTEDIDGLEPGVYTVQVYSQNDFCTATATFIVEGFGALETNLTFDPYGSHACVDPVGGTEPYMIEWIDLNTGEPINNSDVYCVQGLAPGAYMVNVVDANGCEASEIFFIEEPLCSGGEVVVDPSEIESGDNTNFLLYNYSGVSIQWQFKTENTPWLNIPGATSDNYETPDINTVLDKEIWVRAEVICTSGEVVYSSEALLIVFGDPDVNFQEVAADRDLFNPVEAKVEFTTELSTAFPTITEAYVNVQFKATLESTTSVSVMDLNGKLYETTDFVQVNAGQVERLNFRSFPSGMYLIRVQNEKHIVTHKVFVERQ